ncbi:MAG: APC family permease, partial [Dehalococcoidia bacterium]|nr:APC family permease [Dehalococcoidia bacterium]
SLEVYMEEGKLKRQISVPHGILLLIGTVIGASAFILIGPLAKETGPGLWLSYLLAAIPATFIAVVFAQLGTSFPITGATYISVGRLVSPIISFLMVWILVLAIFLFAMPLMAGGFAVYFMQLLPLGGMSADSKDLLMGGLALFCLIFFTVLNIFEIKWMMWFQSMATGIAIIALIVFGFGGVFFGNTALVAPMFPKGFWALIVAIVPAYVMYTGVNAITEMGGETKNPRRSIPRILIISLILLVIIYCSISYAIVALLPYQSLTEGSVTEAAGKFLDPTFALVFMAIGAILASISTVNGGIAFLSRDVMALARNQVFPAALGRINKRTSTPSMAVILAGVLSVLGLVLLVVIGMKNVVRIAAVFSQGFMLMSLLACIAMLRLPHKIPDRYAAASFKLKGFWLRFFTIGGMIIFGGLILIGWFQDPFSAVVFFILAATGLIYYLLRRWFLRRKGVSFEEGLTRIEEEP